MERNLQILTLILLSAACFGQTTKDDDACPTGNHRVMNETWRSTGYDTRATDTPMCDKTVKKGWYRFTGLGGKTVEMATQCPGKDTCGTTIPIWMNGAHPTVADGIITRKLCGKIEKDPNADCCEFEDEVFVKNCDGFYIYYLGAQYNCPTAYCAGSAKRCPVGKWSETNFEPCKDMGLVLDKPPKVTGPNVNSDKSFDFACRIEYGPTDASNTFEVTWTINGKPDTSKQPVILKGAQRLVKLSGDELKGFIDTQIGCQVTAYYAGQEQKKNTYLSNTQLFGVQNLNLTGPRVTIGDSFKFECEVATAPSDPEQKIEVVWTFDGVVDTKIPPRILTGTKRIAAVDGALLAGHLNSNVGCQARLIYDKSEIKTNFQKSSTFFAGLQVIPQKLEISGNEEEKQITVISTIPLICKGGQTCCLTFNLNIDKITVVSLKTTCEYKICSVDWIPVNKQASFNITVVPSRNSIAAGTRNAVLSFTDIVISGTGSYMEVFNGVKLNPVPIVVTLEGGSECSMVTDPHITGFDYKVVYHLYQAGDYTAVDLNYRDFMVQIRTWPCNPVATCICGVLIKEKNDIIRVFGCDKTNLVLSTLDIPYTLSPGAVVQRSADGWHIGVLLQSGSEIKIDIGGVYMNVYIKLPAFDKGKAVGICGTNDGNPANDFTYPNGTVGPVCVGTCFPYSFFEAWRVTGTASMLQVTPEKIPETPPTEFCSCTVNSKGRSVYKCSARQQIQDTQLACTNCQAITKDLEPRTWDITDQKQVLLKPVDPNIKWPNAKGVTEAQAKDLCNQAIQKSPLYSKCQNVNNIAASVIDECLGDILVGGTTEILDGTTATFTSKCQTSLSKDEKNFVADPDGTLKFKPEFNELVCPIECKVHGKCAQDGKCECNAGWGGATCQIDTAKGPQIAFIKGEEGCLTRQNPCDSVELDKTNVNIQDKLKCRVQPVDAKGVKTGQPVIVDAIRVSSSKVTCPLPKKAQRRAVSTDSPPDRFEVSISTDGTKFGNVLTIIAKDSSCVECTETGCNEKTNVCTINSTCYEHGTVNKKNNQQVCDAKKNPTGWSKNTGVPPC